MKHLLILTLVIPLFLSCNNGETGGSQEGKAKVNITPPNPKTPLQTRAIRVFTTNYWIVNMYVKIKQPKLNRVNQGRWYKFNKDGTFEVGKFTKTISKGGWRFFYRGEDAVIALDAENPEEDGEWKVKIASDESIMIWVGTEQFGTNSVQQRLENLLFIPKNRKEMGLQD